jgi:ABC-type thiamin/hydroxymethylpyrimidine transport system permease subunit
LTVGFLAATRSGRVKVAQAGVLLTVKKTSVQYDVIINDLPLLTVNYYVKPIVPVLSVADESPHAVLWASGRRIGTEQMFPDRRVQKPSVPTVLAARLSSGCQSILRELYHFLSYFFQFILINSSFRVIQRDVLTAWSSEPQKHTQHTFTSLV